ncbi:polyamine aminopropyltransferase [Streptomyces sp. NPDC060223]|uniref:polyamine aminopropyltransferase n=1 Tax=unclassified Streptomyces TaxID=2593676 RepID=UPI00363C2F68
MIDPHAPAPPGAPPPWGGVQGQARLPVRQGTGRFLVLAGVFVCAACGLVYELELVALASYLIGDSVTQASVVLSVMVFAMGLGSLAAKRLRPRAAAGFGAIEAALALVGGYSAIALYAVFAWTGDWGGAWGDGSRYLLVTFSLTIGLLIGAEVPLLMELIQRVRRQDPGGAVADLFAADYVGALVGGLAFPFLLLPWLGQLTGALLTGGVNALVGGALVLGLFHRDLTPRARWALVVANLLVLGLLASAAVLVDDFERAARHAVYGAEVRVALQTGVQEVVLTGGTHGRPLDLFLDGRLRVSGRDERRYHEALVHPAMNGPHARVLILGGGDGLAAREVLRYPGVRRVDEVELDAGVVRLARQDPALARLNGHAYDDPRVRVVTSDAFHWLRGAPSTYDVVISDLPDPGITASTKLYSQEFYGLVRRVMAPGGRLAVHAGPVATRPRVFWTVDTTIRTAGLRTTPYRVGGRDSGFAAGPDRTAGASLAPHDWGFVLAARMEAAGTGASGAGASGMGASGSGLSGTGPPLGLEPGGPRPRTLTRAALAADARAASRTRISGLPPSTLVHPRYTG